ncbi:MAG: DsbA family protein [Phenylobacterium sp.]|uniref:DsbA family protein n=1 Tax=Phenylobacterium sp. TaxID=1871053 RepID=UPI002719C23C|nr:DsbA family protein [Phenylobacterium sp.]MDO9430340.1 DsbA family protein [Phenylobacterium sp.]
MTMTTRAALALCAALALPLTACAKKPDDDFGQKVRTYLLAHPEVIEEAVQKLQENKQAAVAEAAKASLGKYRTQLERDPRDFVANPDGKITVVEFFDYRCGYCKVSAPEILKLIAENPDVRFVFKEFPIFGGESNLAAQVALSEPAKPKTLKLFEAFMAEKALDANSIDRHLRAAGVDPAAAKAAGASEAVQKHIADTRALAQALAIEGTPAFIIGDHIVPGADMAAVRAAIAEAKTGKLKTVPDVKPS